MPRVSEGLTVASARDVPPMTYATRIARLRLGAENCSGWVGVLVWCHLWLMYNDWVDLVSLYAVLGALWWCTLYWYGYVLWYIWVNIVYALWCILYIICLVFLAGLQLTGTLLFVPQVRDKHGYHQVMSTESEVTMCICLVKVGSWSQRFCEPSLYNSVFCR